MNTTRAQLLALRQKISPEFAAELQSVIQQHNAEMAHLKYVAACLAAEAGKHSGALRRTVNLQQALDAMQRTVAAL